MDPAALPLRDIHLPPPVSWWPLAPGWWIVFTLVMVGALAATAWWWRRQTLAPRRAALAELVTIERAFATSGDGHACAQGLSRLLRRVALLGHGTAAASASGEVWFEHLATLGAGPVPSTLRTLVQQAPYSPAAAAGLDAAAYRDATSAFRRWLAALRIPRRRPLKGDSHAAV